MEKLQISVLKQLLVVNKDKLLGTLTDGDIRRAFLKGFNISDKIKNIFNQNPIFFSKNKFNLDQASKNLIEEKLLFAPVVNNKKIITDLIFQNQIKILKNNLNKFKNIGVVIMAGGLGKRLLPFTKILPKPLIPINDTPIIDIIIKRFKIWF